MDLWKEGRGFSYLSYTLYVQAYIITDNGKQIQTFSKILVLCNSGKGFTSFTML